MNRIFLAVLVSLFPFAAALHSQSGNSTVVPFSTVFLSISRTYEYRQTGPQLFENVSAKIIIGYYSNEQVAPNAEATLVGKDKTFVLKPATEGVTVGSPSRARTYTLESADFTEIDNAVPVGEYTLTYPTASGDATRKFQIFLAPYVRTLQINDYDSLQSWDGTPLLFSWIPIQNPLYAAASLTFARANGAVAYTASGYSGLGPPPPGSLSAVSPSHLLSTLASTPGDVFTGTLRFQDGSTGVLTPTSNLVLTNDASVLRFPLKRPAPAPIITAHPASLTAVAGTTATLSPTITASGATYVWQKDGTLISGATNATLTLTSVKPSDAGAYTVTATNSGGSVTSNAATLTVVAPTIAPTITTAPANLTVLAGAKSTLTVTPAGSAPFTYQWLRNGTPITAATSATLTLDVTLPTDAAGYSVRITNSAGSVTSPAATLTVTPISRISNLSVLTSLSSAADSFTLGYVIGVNTTTGPKPLLLRAAGPALAALGVAGTLDDPQLELFAGSAKTAENDNWGTSASVASTLTTAFTSVGAFPFASPTSKDAATTAHLTTRDNSVKISAAPTSTSTPSLPTGAAAAPGLVLAEIYDATPTDTFTTATPRLLNVSVLKSLGTGLTVGFTIAGSTAKTVLIRAIGPTLADFGVPGAVTDPQLSLFSATSPTLLATNDNWSVPVASAPNATALTAAFSAVGAFALPPDSRDAALLTTLPPGGYSVQVTGVKNTTGAALVEVYEVP